MKTYPIPPDLAKSLSPMRDVVANSKLLLEQFKSKPPSPENETAMASLRKTILDFEELLAEAPAKRYKWDLAQELATRGFSLGLLATCLFGLVAAFLLKAIPLPSFLSWLLAITGFLVVGIGWPVWAADRRTRRLNEASEDWLEAEVATKKASRRVQSVAGWFLWCAVLGVGGFFLLTGSMSKARESAREMLPELPLRVTYRDPIATSGYVLTIANPSSKPHRVVVTAPSTQPFQFVLGASEIREFGQLEGVSLAAGDMITIEVNGFKSYRATIPK